MTRTFCLGFAILVAGVTIDNQAALAQPPMGPPNPVRDVPPPRDLRPIRRPPNQNQTQQTAPTPAARDAARQAEIRQAQQQVGRGYKQPAKTIQPPVRDERRQLRITVKSWRELQRENVVIQQRDYSCGAAALATLIKYHWDDDSISEMRLLIEALKMLDKEEMKDRIENGLSLADLRRMAVRVGYQAATGEIKLDKLRESKVPLIVGIVVNKFNHFVVYRGMDDYYVYLADPARGNVRTPIHEFAKQWQENAILVVVKPNVKPERVSRLTVRQDEKSLGMWNNLFVRDRVSQGGWGRNN